MKKVAIVGLGWLGMPLALSLTARGWQVTGSKTTQDGVEAARMCGIDSYPLRLEPQLVCDTEDLCLLYTSSPDPSPRSGRPGAGLPLPERHRTAGAAADRCHSRAAGHNRPGGDERRCRRLNLKQE